MIYWGIIEDGERFFYRKGRQDAIDSCRWTRKNHPEHRCQVGTSCGFESWTLDLEATTEAAHAD